MREKIIKALHILKKIVLITASLLILLIGLDLIKHVLIGGFHTEFLANFFDSPVKSFFISYLMTEITMSGSPIAGAFISLGETLNLSATNLAAIVMGTRGGVNSFLLITGLLMLLKGKSLRRSLGITVIQFFVTLSITFFAAIFIIPILRGDLMHSLAINISDGFVINGAFENITGLVSNIVKTHVSSTALTVIIGLVLMIGGLFTFDKSFSFLKDPHNKKILQKFENKRTAFFGGFLVTALTMSLSVSVTILLPLYIRKLIDRRLLIAYILGANISTLFDTLFLGIITQSILGIKVILSFLVAVICAVLFYLVIFRRYRRGIGHITDKILKHKYLFIVFMATVMLIPLLFIFF